MMNNPIIRSLSLSLIIVLAACGRHEPTSELNPSSTTVDAGVSSPIDSGAATVQVDAATPHDAMPTNLDASAVIDAGQPLDTGTMLADASTPLDASQAMDASALDATPLSDASALDAGVPMDAGQLQDAGTVPDAGPPSHWDAQGNCIRTPPVAQVGMSIRYVCTDAVRVRLGSTSLQNTNGASREVDWIIDPSDPATLTRTITDATGCYLWEYPFLAAGDPNLGDCFVVESSHCDGTPTEIREQEPFQGPSNRWRWNERRRTP